MSNVKPGDLALIAYPNPANGSLDNCGKIVRVIEPWGDKPRVAHNIYFGYPIGNHGFLWLVEAQSGLLVYKHLYPSLHKTTRKHTPLGPISDSRLVPLGDESLLVEERNEKELEKV